MGMKFTQIPADAFEQLQLNAGVLASDFTPATGTLVATNILGATSGGVNFVATPAYSDYGEGMDNCPKNMMELKKLDKWEIKMSGTFLTVSGALAKQLAGSADVATADSLSTITPRNNVATTDFDDIWWIGDYSDKNGATNGGFVAIKMMNALSTGGFQIQSTDKGKGQFAFEFTAHYSNATPDTVPFLAYIKNGAAESAV